MDKRRVLVVDDSPFMRKLITRALEADGRIEIAGVGRNGVEAVEKTAELKPDAITLDIEMPKMDGLTALMKIMKKNPVPAVMVSSLTKEGADITLKCLEAGAVDFILKPSHDDPYIRERLRLDLARKVLYAASVDVGQKWKVENTHGDLENYYREKKRYRALSLAGDFGTITGVKAVAIGISTGGPKNLLKVIPGLPGNIDANIFIVQHMPEFFTKSFAERLNSLSELYVKEAEDGEIVEKGVAYLARGGMHMKVVKRPGVNEAVIRLESGNHNDIHVPSVDIMMNSVASAFRENTIGVIMTGMGRDGVEGMRLIKEVGGRTIAENKATAVIYGMPAAAVEEGVIDEELPCYLIAKKIMEYVK